MKNKDLNYYLNLPWSYRFEWSNKDNCYVASVLELKGCMSCGDTIQEAVDMIKDALVSYIEACLEHSDEIPEPLKPVDYKGNITFRTKSDKHYRLAMRANADGISLNQLIERATDLFLKSA